MSLWDLMLRNFAYLPVVTRQRGHRHHRRRPHRNRHYHYPPITIFNLSIF